ncbi:MAG TPA: adenylate/guanylate cyclase domain-containing protein [Candidatus Limnocylindrales bacterium]|nr:adenylate/guanylate cyclase domain-containing protein [Candidatus Limnocylindrales bacterium]
MARLTRTSLAAPNADRSLGRAEGALASAGALAVGRAWLEPGWRWSEDVKPVAGTSSCMVHHVQVLLRGRLAVRLDDGEEMAFEPGDVFEIPPGHDSWVIGEEPADLLDISGNVGEFGLPASVGRAVVTLFMSDIVGSTEKLARVGDAAWKQLLADHDRLVRAELRRSRGREIDTTGDGFLAEFDSAASALECALRVCKAVEGISLRVRIGVHTGEIERVSNDVRGLAVHTVARVMSAAGPGEVLASTTTRLLSAGSPHLFESRGEHALKGLPTPMELFAVRPL